MNMPKLCALIAGMAASAAGCIGPWRAYEIYQPEVRISDIYDGAKGKLKYNHCASVAWYRDRWVAVWNANTIPIEGRPSQPIVLSTSTDFTHWTEPVEPFNDPRICANPVTMGKGRQWQPSLLVYRGELWCTWSQSSGGDDGTYWSCLRDPQGKWTNRKLEFGDEAVIGGVRYDRFFPSQNPVILRSGRVLAPLNAFGPTMPIDQDVDPWRKRRKLNTVMYTDDGGKTWHLSPGATIPGFEWACWEPTVWETPDGIVRMLARNNNWADVNKGGHPATKMLTRSLSRDGGATWTPHEFVPIETICSRMHVLPLGGDRFVMVHNDWRKAAFAGDRQNLALFFNREGGWDFVAGVNISGRDTFVAYPQMFVKDNALHIAYTGQGVPAAIRYSRVTPLPDPNRYYLFPRSNTPPSALPRVEGDALALDAWQRVETRWAKRDGRTDLSLGMWIKVARAGVLLDSRRPGKGGLLFHLMATDAGVSPAAALSTKEKDLPSTLVLPDREWRYVGLSIDNAQRKAHFLVDGQSDVREFSAPAPLAGDTAYLGFKRFEQSACRGFVGQIRWAAVYDGRCLTAGQHRSLFNARAAALGRAELPGAEPAPKPNCELDPSKPDWATGFVLPDDETMSAKAVQSDGRPCVRFNGEASAGVDLDRNRPAEGDQVEFEFAFRLEAQPGADDEFVLCTTGGGDRPLRVVVNGRRPDTVQVRLDGGLTEVGRLAASGWTPVRIQIRADACRVSAGASEAVTVPFPTADTWVYIGQGYLEGRVRSQQAFLADLSSVRSRVIRKE